MRARGLGLDLEHRELVEDVERSDSEDNEEKEEGEGEQGSGPLMARIERPRGMEVVDMAVSVG